jgi:DNA mismatch repair ATPase MutS
VAGKSDKRRKKKYSPEDSLKQGKSPKVRKEFIDYDYIQDLDPESRAFLAKFNNEYYGAAVSKTKAGKIRAKHLHRDVHQVKEIYDDNNRRNNDVLGVSRANIGLTDIEAETRSNDGWYITNSSLQEEAIVSTLDMLENEQLFLTFEEYQEVKNSLTMEMQMFYEAYFNGDLED